MRICIEGVVSGRDGEGNEPDREEVPQGRGM